MTDPQTQLLDRVAKAMGFPYFLHTGVNGVGDGRFYYPEPNTVSANHLSLSWTLDSAAKCLPPGWTWARWGDSEWVAQPSGMNPKIIHTPDTDCEITDRYRLAAIAWESQGKDTTHA